MSHDQRPGRMRVVKDPSESDRRRGNAVATEDPNSFEVSGGAAEAETPDASGKTAFGLLPAGLFLLACAAGGALVAVVRPLGLG